MTAHTSQGGLETKVLSASRIEALSPVTNDAKLIIEDGAPYAIEATVEGVAPFIFHRWSVDSIDAKSKAAKGSKAKKEDDVESYVYRDRAGLLAIPSVYLHMAIVNAAKYKQDPRSPRKSAMDLCKAGFAGIEEFCTLGVKTWDYLDKRRVVVQRNGITRVRPALSEGWRATFPLMVLLPEYITPALANELVQMAGRLIGIGDHRPTFGRFQVTKFAILKV